MSHKNNKKLRSLLIIIFVMICCFNFQTFAGWVQRENKSYQYVNEQTGELVKNNWIQTNYGYYYLDKDGYMATGWFLINDDYYYFSTNGIMQTGFITTNDNTYYLDVDTGKMVKGWIQIKEDDVVDYYYFKENGAMAKNWLQINNDWYYFQDGKAIIDAWAAINNKWYHFNQDGKMHTGWFSQNGKYYYLSTQSGQMMTGFITDNQGYQYYLNPQDGTLVMSQTVDIAGNTYTFNDKGQVVTNYTVVPLNNQTTTNYVQSFNYNTGDIVSNDAFVAVGISPSTQTNETQITTTQKIIKQQEPLKEGSTEGPN